MLVRDVCVGAMLTLVVGCSASSETSGGAGASASAAGNGGFGATGGSGGFGASGGSGGFGAVGGGGARASELGITIGQTYPMDIFQAERHTVGSSFRIETTIDFTCVVNIPPLD